MPFHLKTHEVTLTLIELKSFFRFNHPNPKRGGEGRFLRLEGRGPVGKQG